MNKKRQILIVEDDDAISRVLSSILSANDYTPLIAKTGEQALLLASSYNPDVILLDLGLPHMDGMDVLHRLREWYERPIVIVSARDQNEDKVNGLDGGADDYITKPFSSAELMARIRAAMRSSNHLQNNEGNASSYAVGDFVIDFEKHRVFVEGEEKHLTPIECKIVELLARNPGRVLTYDTIMKALWGPFLTETNKILRVNMANIRRKIEKNPADPQTILTEMGVGYRMST